jgi:hypothetical protein
MINKLREQKSQEDLDISLESKGDGSTCFSSHSDVFTSSYFYPLSPQPLSSFDFEDSVESLNIESISQMACTKLGSKKLQQIIAMARPDGIEKIVLAVSDSMGDLMVDLYGNYMCQTLLQSCSAAQRLVLLSSMQNSLTKISCNPRGTHALQNLIALASLTEEENIYQQSFKGSILKLSKDPNSSHVIQRMLSTLKNKFFILKEILGHIVELSTDRLGLCVIKKCVKDPQVFNEIMEHCLVLMQDPYGNYAVQLALDTWKEECTFEFISGIQGKTAQLCIQKYASNVMEKGMKIENIRNGILKEIINEDKLDVLLGSPYGCYVLRTAAQECDKRGKSELAEAMNRTSLRLHNARLKVHWDEIISSLR